MKGERLLKNKVRAPGEGEQLSQGEGSHGEEASKSILRQEGIWITSYSLGESDTFVSCQDGPGFKICKMYTFCRGG